MPITPDAAWAYVNTLGGTEEQHKTALEAAGKIWDPRTSYVRGDNQDAYYVACFGPAGPLAKEAQFVEMAKRVMGPLWRHQMPGEAAV